MIKRELKLKVSNEVFFAMSDAVVLAASIKTALLEIARHAHALGNGLQNAAPADKALTPNNSVSYLLNTSENIMKIADECGRLALKNVE